jgi:hypothetical protein
MRILDVQIRLVVALGACLTALAFSPVLAAADAQTGSITGHIVNSVDSPVANVVVTTSDPSGTVYTVTTDPAGSFTLGNLPAPANYVLTFTPPAGYSAPNFPAATTDGQTNDIGSITLQAQPGAIVGAITDQNGVPLYGMQVSAGELNSTTTGPGGRYALTGVLPGSYTLSVKDGNDDLSEGIVTVAGATSTANVTLPPPAVPAGTAAQNTARDLSYLNAERAALGLPSGIVENPRWAVECAAHNRYLLDNHLLQHPENPSQPGASPGGAWAGLSAVLSEGARWIGHRNPWENAPIHLDQLFSPSLSVIGIDDSNGYVCATTWPGMLRPAVTTDTIFTYPGNRARGVPTSEVANENPFVPGQFVGIPPGRTAGRELFVYLNKAGELGQAPVTIKSVTLSGSSGPVAVRSVGTTTKEIGPYLAGGILLPVKPLTAGTSYTVSVTVADGTGKLSHAWSFTTAGKAPRPRHHAPRRGRI